MLAEELKDNLKREETSNAIVLGIPRAGVVTAHIVAKKLNINNFGVIIPRKLTIPGDAEQALGAIMKDGTAYINDALLSKLSVTNEYMQSERTAQIKEIERRNALYHAELMPTQFSYQTIIVADDGAATGATIIVAARWIRENLVCNQERLIIALPIAPKHTVKLLKEESDADVYVVLIPSSLSFRSIEQYYNEFEQVTDNQVLEILKQRNI